MKNDTHYNKLTLVDDSQESNANSNVADAGGQAKKTFFLFLAISVTCAAATLITGTYAAWLSRQQAARQALTDVNDILKSCQKRMSQLEADVQLLPNRQA